MKPDFPTDAMIEAGMGELHSKWISLIDRAKLSSVYLAMEAAKYAHGDGVTYGLEASRPTKVTNQPIAEVPGDQVTISDEDIPGFSIADSEVALQAISDFGQLQEALEKLEALNSQLRMAEDTIVELTASIRGKGPKDGKVLARADALLVTIKGTGR